MRELSWTSKNLLLFLNTRNNWDGGRLIRAVGDRHRMRIESLFPSCSLVLNVWENIICVRQLGFFSNAQDWQYFHYCQLCIPFLYNCNFLLYLSQLMLVNVKYNDSQYERIKFQDCRLHQFSQLILLQPKWSWQYWHCCIVESLWKTLLDNSTRSQTHKVDNNGINANFLFPYICSFLHYLDLKKLSKCGIRCQLSKGITFQGCRL